MSLRVLVTGSRDWVNRWAIRKALDDLAFAHGFEGMTVVHGDCPSGADNLADQWALDHEFLGVNPPERHPADWDKYGRAAGPIRNKEMVDLGADVVLAFPKGKSAGTRGCIKLAQEAGLDVKITEG